MRNKMKNLSYKSLLGMLLIGLIVGGGLMAAGATLADTAKENAVNSLAGFLREHPDNKIAEYLGRYIVGDVAVDNLIGSAVRTETATNFECVGTKDDNSSLTKVKCFSRVDFPNTGSVHPVVEILDNRTGTEIFVERVFVNTSGTASSTYAFSVFTTSTAAASVPWNVAQTTAGLTNATGTVWMQLIVPTSTVGYVYDSLDNSLATKASSTIRVLNGKKLNFFVKQPYNPECNPAAALCESVTSTNRGWDGTVNVEWSYYKAF